MALFCDMSSLTAEKAEVLVETALLLLLSQFAIFSELEGEVRVVLLLVGIAASRVVVAG